MYKGLNTQGVENTLQRLENSNRIPSKEKFRMMPCKTFIMCGGCPYHERCVFLHDPRTRNDMTKAKPTKSLRPENTSAKDSFYWPDMLLDDIVQQLDSNRLPTAEQKYIIPEMFRTDDTHNSAIYSMWNHFVHYCMKRRTVVNKTYSTVAASSQDLTVMNVNETQNAFIPHRRLNVFVALSQGKNALGDLPTAETIPLSSSQPAKKSLGSLAGRGHISLNILYDGDFYVPYSISQTVSPTITNTTDETGWTDAEDDYADLLSINTNPL